MSVLDDYYVFVFFLNIQTRYKNWSSLHFLLEPHDFTIKHAQQCVYCSNIHVTYPRPGSVLHWGPTR